MDDPDDPKDLAQEELSMTGLAPGMIFRHYKGGLYSIVCVGIKEDTLEPMVAYRSNAKGTVWVRTLANFMETAKPEGRVEWVPRFTHVRE